MASLVVAVLILAISGRSVATWCVCKEGLSDAVLQRALDYACGAGADCNPIRQNGICFQPNTVRAHCSYAANSYFQRKGQAAGSCDFAGTASFSIADPSANGCVYPSSATSSATTPTAPVTTTPTAPVTTTPTAPVTTTPITTTPTTSAPITMTPTTPTTTNSSYTTTPTGILPGVMGPSGINNDMSHGGFRPLLSGLQLAVCSWGLALVQYNARIESV
ncbi:hypothetical protein SAY86_006841 [Trapa natans]|uniref:X8 domain-containing protein n=1 Tax=Trapa natans TaxID=22666 RepID=A0AAN7QY04_TRANT|nr:hypothetical protein SAY86_006841 [Trapa natans]